MLNHFYQDYPYLAWPLQIAVMLPLIAFLVSLLGGWRSLASEYQTERKMPAKSFHLTSGAFRYLAGYNNILRIGADQEGLYLRCWLRLFHPPLFLPWSAVEIKKPFRWIFKQQTLMLGRPRWVPFTISARVVKRLMEARELAPQPPAPYGINADGPMILPR